MFDKIKMARWLDIDKLQEQARDEALLLSTRWDVPQGPDMVFLYRRAILDYWAERDLTLGRLVTHVLVHEIGHHFGLSDEDMLRIEAGTAD